MTYIRIISERVEKWLLIAYIRILTVKVEEGQISMLSAISAVADKITNWLGNAKSNFWALTIQENKKETPCLWMLAIYFHISVAFFLPCHLGEKSNCFICFNIVTVSTVSIRYHSVLIPSAKYVLIANIVILCNTCWKKRNAQ